MNDSELNDSELPEVFNPDSTDPGAMMAARVSDPLGYLASRNRFLARAFTQLSENLTEIATAFRAPLYTYLDDPASSVVILHQAEAIQRVSQTLVMEFELSRQIERGGADVDEQVSQFAQELSGLLGTVLPSSEAADPQIDGLGDDPKPPTDEI